MAEDQEAKTEPATPRRRQEAFDSGNFPRSQDLTGSVLLLTGLLIIKFMGQNIVLQLSDMMRGLLGNNYWATSSELVDNSLRIAGKPLFLIMWPILLVMLFASIVVNVFQVGLRYTTKPLMLNFTRLNPMAGMGRLFAGQNFMQMGFNLIKLTAVVGTAWVQIRAQLPLVMNLSALEFPQNMTIGFGIVLDLGFRIAITLLILAILDWMYRKWRFERGIRMTKQEVKDEARSMDGDPEVKGRRRALARKMIMQRIQSDVPRADVVVTNPTHLAIAIKYDPETMTAPRVVAKGADFLALRIRQVALANNVPLVERKPLAQALYKSVEIGQEVPPEFYQAIAEILAYVYELAGKKPNLRKAG